MIWEHSVDEEWLSARKDIITATELVSLIPEYKRAAKSGGNDIALGFAALWAEKNSDSELDPRSYGAAARGHILEPYAVDTWNSVMSDRMYHWDDCVIKNNGLGFSPDAMDVEQEAPYPELEVKFGYLYDSDGSEHLLPEKILEVKSYSPSHHYQNMVVDKMDKQVEKERRQIAVAMMVLPSIKTGCLVHYCPQAKHQMFFYEYTREELADDIELLEKVLSMWNDTCRKMDSLPKAFKSPWSEKDIYKEYVSTKTIM